MAEKKKKKKSNNKELSYSLFDFSEPVSFTKTSFGIKKEEVSVFTIDMNVASLIKNFQIFEELQNVHEWPISKLIQRELDHKRASNICQDYLLEDKDLKYFPPLTAVLIPTETTHLPKDVYPVVKDEEFEAINAKIIKPREELYNDFQQVNIPVGGIYVIPFDGYSGDIVWDKSQISAVIIDGQHRYKALIESTEKNKNYLECRVVVNLVDLIPICSRDNRGPTDIARDLFVTINNTPVEVDESRLILMDDKDVLSTFTQVLVDDSDAEAKPAIQPELIDWKCDGAKHDSDVSVSGIIPLRQVVQSSMFSNLSISSIDDRQNKKKVRTWLDWLNSWLNQDEEIKAQLGIQETLERRYEVANLDDEEDEGEEGLFLFSYSSKATQIIKEKFKILYLPVFRLSYSELLPYKECTELAVAEGVFDKSTNIHKYLRAFTGTRKILEKDAVIKSEIDSFKKKFKEITYNSIPHTVMGQKAIFKTLFEYYISTVDEYDEKKILKIALSFVKNFNDVYEKLSPTKNIDENLLNIKYKMDKAVDVNKAGDLGRDIWRGIILKQNGEIDYSSNSVSILSAVFADILEFYISDEGNNFKFSGGVRKKILNKHKRIIKNIDSEIDEGEALKISENIIKGKEKKFHQVLSG